MKTSEKVKKKIEELINLGDNDNAKILLEKYYKIGKDDFEYYTFSGILKMLENDYISAMQEFKIGLLYNDCSFDLNYNLAFIYENNNEYSKAHWHYKKCRDLESNKETKIELEIKLNDLEKKKEIEYKNYEKKIVFLVKTGMDSFLDDIIANISNQYNVLKLIVTEYKQIDLAMNWADLCWFEWCDELVSYGSNLSIATEKKIVCRLHSYEAFTDYISKVQWRNINKIIFISKSVRDYVVKAIEELDENDTIVIPNGIDLGKWTYKERRHGYNIAYVGYINYKKGPMLLLHVFKAIYDVDNRYKLYIAGKFQDDRDVLYFEQMIKEFGLENNIFFEGWQENLDDWLEDKNYIICTSILESQNMSVMQAMAKGIKPLIHNFVGARKIYDSRYIWNSINEARLMLQSNVYDSKEFNNFIKNNYSLEKEINSLLEILGKTLNKKVDTKIINPNIIETGYLGGNNKPLVTIGIINYNCSKYLETCVESFLNQTYTNIEILIIDDFSTDDSRNKIKILENRYPNIRGIYHESNSGGPSKAINEIIDQSKGKYFQWISSDDYVSTEEIEKFVYYLESSNKDYVYCNYNVIDENNNIKNEWRYDSISIEEMVKKIFWSGSGVIPMNGLYRKSFFHDNNINWLVYRGNDYSCDTLNSLYFAKNGLKYGFLKLNLIYYRIHDKNHSHNIDKRIETSITLYDFIIKNFDISLYFTDINWNECKNKKQLKNYVLSLFYYNQIHKYLKSEAIPSYINSDVNFNENSKPIKLMALEGFKYIEESLDDGGNLMDQIIELKEMYTKYL